MFDVGDRLTAAGGPQRPDNRRREPRSCTSNSWLRNRPLRPPYNIVPKIVGQRGTRLDPGLHQGQAGPAGQTAGPFRGYRRLAAGGLAHRRCRSMPIRWVCQALKAKLEWQAMAVGLNYKDGRCQGEVGFSARPIGRRRVRPGFLGMSLPSMLSTLASTPTWDKARYRDPDAIRAGHLGGAGTRVAAAGLFSGGLAKIQAARQVSAHGARAQSVPELSGVPPGAAGSGWC